MFKGEKKATNSSLIKLFDIKSYGKMKKYLENVNMSIEEFMKKIKLVIPEEIIKIKFGKTNILEVVSEFRTYIIILNDDNSRIIVESKNTIDKRTYKLNVKSHENVIEDATEKIDEFEIYVDYSTGNTLATIEFFAYAIELSFASVYSNFHNLIRENIGSLSDMQNIVVILEWLKSFMMKLPENFTASLFATKGEYIGVEYCEELFDINEGKAKNISIKTDYYSAQICENGAWSFEIDGICVSRDSNIYEITQFQDFARKGIEPKEFKEAMKVIISKLFNQANEIREILCK